MRPYPWHTPMQFCFTGQDPNSAPQNLALKVVYSIGMEWGERKKDEQGKWRAKSGLLLLGGFKMQQQIKVVMEGLGALFWQKGQQQPQKKRQCREAKAGVGRETLEKNIINQDVNVRLIEALTLWLGRAFCKAGWRSRCCLQAQNKYCRTSPKQCSKIQRAEY